MAGLGIKAAAHEFGNAGNGDLVGPDQVNFDFSAFKNFRITERHVFEFRTDMVNFTNTPVLNFGQEFNGQHTATASNFGEIVSSQNARQIQFALKYRF